MSVEEIGVELVPEAERKEKPGDILELSFGTVFTDHMLTQEYADGSWLQPEIKPFQMLSLSTAALVLHYGQGIFEGLKAYRRERKVLLFRPLDNFKRLNRSAQRMVMPEIDADLALESLEELLRIEQDWVPDVPGSSLYIRPTMIGTQAKLGVKPSDTYLYFVILSPVGPYFKEGFSPVKIMVTDRYVRAAQGGIGEAKTMGNYAACLKAESEANSIGCSQVLWLDAKERKYLEEVGTMNIFVRFDDELATPPVSGTILPGITRDSVLRVAKDWGLNVVERRIALDEVFEGLETGKTEEIFGCGTAAIIAPVGTLHYKNMAYSIGGGTIGTLTRQLYDELTGIQCGEKEDKHNWVVRVI